MSTGDILAEPLEVRIYYNFQRKGEDIPSIETTTYSDFQRVCENIHLSTTQIFHFFSSKHTQDNGQTKSHIGATPHQKKNKENFKFT